MKHHIIIALLLGLSQIKAFTPLPPEQPLLIVNIVLDNVSLQDIERNSDLLTSNGFLKLKNEGCSFTNTSFPYLSRDRVCDYTSLMTGSSPAKHGIIGSQWYNRKLERHTSSIHSKNSVLVGANTSGHGGDASQLVVSTICDELKLHTKSKAKCYSISLHQDAAILLAGHAANGAFWLDEKSGQWVSSDYYMPWLPDWLKQFNNKSLSDFYLSQEWTLAYKAQKYNANTLSYDPKTFPITPADLQNPAAPYAILKSMPLGNMLVTDIALALIAEEGIGNDATPDFLSINYGSIEHKEIPNTPLSVEKADFVLKLDQEIERLTLYLDENIGLENCLITLSSTKTDSYSEAYLEQHHISHGTFAPSKALALLNSYLMALYGQGNWVLDYSNSQVYLNKTLITKAGIDIQEIQEIIADFLEEFTGVAHAVPAYHLRYSNAHTPTIEAMQSSYFANKSGDIMVSLSPGWKENSNTSAQNHFDSPLFFYGWKIKRNNISTAIKNIDIASNWAYILHIPKPNSSSNKLVIDKLVTNK